MMVGLNDATTLTQQHGHNNDVVMMVAMDD